MLVSIGTYLTSLRVVSLGIDVYKQIGSASDAVVLGSAPTSSVIVIITINLIQRGIHSLKCVSVICVC